MVKNLVTFLIRNNKISQKFFWEILLFFKEDSDIVKQNREVLSLKKQIITRNF